MIEETKMDREMTSTRSLSPHTLLSSHVMPTTSSGAQSRSVATLTLPLRSLCRRVMRHPNLPVSLSRHSHLSVDAALNVTKSDATDNDGGTISGGGCDVIVSDEQILAYPYGTKGSESCIHNDSGKDMFETDIDDVDEFS
ncbi:unnamed protein product [Hydatigera taeniaeformis]|uniref:Uncharacterized protein n=1 Tax=Hydatigena taeniaeformis TaxID=6205 RepID=A0A0R3WUG9_HYDTA|nr:unnamed protein product [Hydatigera taeniaeformis]